MKYAIRKHILHLLDAPHAGARIEMLEKMLLESSEWRDAPHAGARIEILSRCWPDIGAT